MPEGRRHPLGSLRCQGVHRSRRLIAVFLVLAAAIHLAGACRCPARLSYRNAYDRAAVVVTGKVSSFRPGPEPASWVAVVAVTRAWKMSVPDSVIVATSTTCAVQLNEGQDYLLYLYRNPDGSFYTSKCVGNLPIQSAHGALSWLGRYATPSKK